MREAINKLEEATAKFDKKRKRPLKKEKLDPYGTLHGKNNTE